MNSLEVRRDLSEYTSSSSSGAQMTSKVQFLLKRTGGAVKMIIHTPLLGMNWLFFSENSSDLGHYFWALQEKKSQFGGPVPTPNTGSSRP